MAKLLIADDNTIFCQNLAIQFRHENYVVDIAEDGEAALEFLSRYKYDVAILDWDMPLYSGMEVCLRHRESGGVTPILMLTGKSSVEDKVDALEAGADDYLTKPFNPKELSARLRALLRRPPLCEQTKLSFGHVELDPALGKVHVAGKETHFQPVEYALLEYFLHHRNQIFSIEDLTNNVWDAETSVSADSIYSCMRRIRRKLEVDGQGALIKNVHGRGYILES